MPRIEIKTIAGTAETVERAIEEEKAEKKTTRKKAEKKQEQNK